MDVFFHVADDPVVGLIGASQAGAPQGVGRYRKRVCKVAAVQVDEKLFQVIADKLLGPKAGGEGVADKLFLVGIVQTAGKRVAGFDDDLGQKRIFRFLYSQYLIAEYLHVGGMALEGDYNKAGRDAAVGDDIMKFVGLVEDDAAPL